MGSIRDMALIVVSAIAVIWMLQSAQEVFVPLVLALLISYALEPCVFWFERHRVPRFAGSSILVLFVAASVAFGVYAFSDDAIAIVEDLPRTAQQFERSLSSGQGGFVEKVISAARAIESTATHTSTTTRAPEGVTRVQVEEKPIDLTGIVFWGSVGILTGLGQLVLLLFLVFFLLLSGDLFRRKLVNIAGPALAKKRVTIEILTEINDQIERYVLVQIFVGIVVAVASALAFKFLGLQRAVFWGFAAGLFNSIPYIGPVIVAGGVTVVAFLQFGSLDMAMWTAVTATAITSLEGWLLTPLLLGKAARMNGVAVFVGLLFWTWVWGAWGMLLAVPMMVIVKAVCEHVHDLKPVAELLGE